MGEVASGKRQGGHPAHEGKHLCVLSVLCVRKFHDYPQSNIEWEGGLSWSKNSQQYQELDGLD